MPVLHQNNSNQVDLLQKKNLYDIGGEFTCPMSFTHMSQPINLNSSADMAWQHSLQLSLNGDPTTWDFSGDNVMTKPQNNDFSQFNTMNGTDLWDITVNDQEVQALNKGIDGRGAQQKVSTGHPMPVVDRSQTQPLWQRRLNAKNKELQSMHTRTSDPNVTGARRSPSDLSTHYGSVAPSMIDETSTQTNFDNDLTHASPETMRMLQGDFGGDQQQTANQISGASKKDSLSSEYGLSSSMDNNVLQSMQQIAIQNIPGDNHQNGSNMAFTDPFSNGKMMPEIYPHDVNAMNFLDSSINGMPAPHTQQASSPRLYGQAILTNGAKTRRVRGLSSSSMKLAVHDLAAASDNTGSTTSPQSASSAQMQGVIHGSGKGMINKVIVPPAPGTLSDAVDVRTGETGQMRHMCPHAGCDKHFSTSGHARRHSRIHDCLRPFECPHEGCHATFTRRDNCTQHQRARHKFQLVAHRVGDRHDEL